MRYIALSLSFLLVCGDAARTAEPDPLVEHALYVSDPTEAGKPDVVRVEYVSAPETIAAASGDNLRNSLSFFQRAFLEPVAKPLESVVPGVEPVQATMPMAFEGGFDGRLNAIALSGLAFTDTDLALQQQQISTANPANTNEPPADHNNLIQADLPPADLSLCGDANSIDLVTTLRLAGASNVQIALARERVFEANARLKSAKAMWLPSLNAGIGYNNHTGRIQDTRGQVIEVSRSSVFAGGGAVLSGMPLTGGSGGPARLFIDLSLSDALFEPLAAQQQVRAVAAARNATFNDVLMNAAIAYLDLVHAQGQRAIALKTVQNAEELVRLTDAQQKANVGLPADVQRARAELALRERQVLSGQENIGVASANLARLLRLDPCCGLCSLDERPIRLDFVDLGTPLCDLIAQGIACRPERREALAFVRESNTRRQQEMMRPWLPNIHVGYSAGGFGGGQGSFIGNYGSRGDVDVLAVWQLRNMGVGTRALREEAASRQRQAQLIAAGVRDQIGADVSAAFHQVSARREQIDVTRRRVEAAETALPLNFRGILGRQLRAIEAQQAIQALYAAWNEHLDAIIRYNQGQLQLLRAVGQPANPQLVACQPMSSYEVEASVETPVAMEALVDYGEE
jgi:outer membrane protein TolC